jgi:hypothetical protein
MTTISKGYRRPFSESELRQIRRDKRREVVVCGVAVSVVLSGMVSLLYALYQHGPR